ncbi:MAG: Na+/H+ antiporter subunit E [Gammaproteobacteria bacterium]
MKHTIRLAALLFGLWLGLSGHLEALLLLLGAASTAVVVSIARRMDSVDNERHAAHVPLRLLRFWVYLIGRVILGNLHVIRCIVTPGKTISPQLFTVPLPQKSDLGRVIYANSITLTPGTLTLQIGPDCLLVHALTRHTASELQSGRMAGKVPDFPLEDYT